jgi:hypothetical protein
VTRIRRSAHVTKLINDLADEIYGAAIARATGAPVSEYQERAKLVGTRLLRQGVLPLELRAMILEMVEDAVKLTKALAR